MSREEEEREAAESDEQGEGEDGEERREGASGPWNKSSGTPAPVAATVAPPGISLSSVRSLVT